jgi:non-specific serine/threonine protein kinase
VLGSADDATILGVALSTIAGLTLQADPVRALRLAGAAAGVRERVGGAYPPATVQELDAIWRAGNDKLGALEATRYWEQGRRLDPADAARLAAGRRARAAAAPITPRQLEVARLVADGRTNAQIAAELHLSERTVENHVFNALRLLGLHNRVQLSAWVTKRDSVNA